MKNRILRLTFLLLVSCSNPAKEAEKAKQKVVEDSLRTEIQKSQHRLDSLNSEMAKMRHTIDSLGM